ncbi:rhodanese-like domain-containing protein [Aureitalea marina]|uniref:Rhodanese n=1 Tax=Aureitalea marina TaxID=930804 RepID=A0A2S7KQF1_9FLAO|nr:rhodanese-like domain-containing protein [Aureitalea marina]PQB04859.1 rhodanese [Aureitalea marina]
MPDLTQDQWKSQLAADNEAVILDVRTKEEFDEVSIPGAKQIDIYDPPSFMEAVQQLDASKNYYVYCRSGGRSAQACAVLNSIGIESTYNLLGGIMEWSGETVPN